ncbi:MAG: UvrD-helicase domain-containing protein [Burkholderiaceae bacterium]|jgi:ATP-dependent DNA helicase Rep
MTHPEILNPAQREAVRHLDSPCLVLAGAGSGKTRVITQKIAHLISTSAYEPQHIAALTFTNKAAKEMQQRLADLLEVRASRGLTVCTFHALGVSILRAEAEHARLKPQFSILDGDDAFGILQQLAATTDRALVRGVQSRISLWKNALVSPAMAADLACDGFEVNAAQIYRNYVSTLAAYQAVDFDDLIQRPTEVFVEHPEVLYRWQSRLRYLLIDEVQDTNLCQYRLLRLLVGTRAAFTAVGDDDQAIYGWRGATAENLQSLKDDYPHLRVIKLEQNYRSTGRILAAANALIGHNPKMFPKELWSEHGPGDALVIQAYPNEEQEAESVAIQISAHRFERRARYADYAVLYRSNHQARVLEQAFRKEKIPYVVSGGQSFFDRVEIKDICAWLRLIANQDDDPAFVRAVTTPRRGIGAGTLETLGAYAGSRQVSLFAAACESSLALKLEARRLEPLLEFTRFINRMEWRATREPAGDLLHELVGAIAFEAHLFDNHDSRTAQSRWQNVLDFLAWIRERATSENKTLLEMTQSVALLSMLEGRENDGDAVRLSTLHAAKGLEFPHVFLVGVEEGLLPHGGDPAEEEIPGAVRIEEERRLMYVGITRAQRSLHLTWCQKRRRGRDFEAREPSRFLAELALEKVTFAPAEKMTPEARLAGLKALLVKPKAA